MAFSDDFNRANENLGASANWTVVTGVADAAVISSNQLATNTTQTNGLIVSPDEGSADHSVEWTLQNVYTHSYVAVRATDGDNFIGARGWDNKWHIDKCVAGTWTYAHGEWLSAPVSGDVARLECVGDTIKLFVNDVERISVTDAFNNTETRQGIVPINSSVDPWIDSYSTSSTAATPTVTSVDTDEIIYLGQGYIVISTTDIPVSVNYGADIGGEDAVFVSRNSDLFVFQLTDEINALTANSPLTIQPRSAM